MIYPPKREIVYSVEHFYPKHPGHPIAPLTAEHRSFFRDEGVTCSNLTIAGDDTGSIDLLLEGKTTFSMDAHPAMVIEANAKGKDLYIIGSYRNGLPFGIAALTGSIRRPADLKGKRLATNRRFGAGERMVRGAFAKLGFDPDKDLEIVLVHNEGMREKVDTLREGLADFLVYHFNNPMGLEGNLAGGEVETVLDLSTLLEGSDLGNGISPKAGFSSRIRSSPASKALRRTSKISRPKAVWTRATTSARWCAANWPAARPKSWDGEATEADEDSDRFFGEERCRRDA